MGKLDLMKKKVYKFLSRVDLRDEKQKSVNRANEKSALLLYMRGSRSLYVGFSYFLCVQDA